MSKILLKPVIFLCVILTAIISFILFILPNGDHEVSDEVVKAINNNTGGRSSCKIVMKNFTDFKWDKMVIYNLGSSEIEVSKALGFEFTGSTDLMSGIIFAYKKKIVYEEKIPYYPEKPSQIEYLLNDKPKCRTYTPKTAVFNGSKENIDGKYYYTVVPRS